MTYRGKFEKAINEFVNSSPELTKAVEEEDDDKIEELVKEQFLYRPEDYFSADKLIKAYDIPSTISGFIYSALGKKSLPTKRELSKDTSSSISSMFQLSYEEERLVETTTNLIVDNPKAMESFLNNDFINVFKAPQFTQLGGISTLRKFDKRDLVFDALKDSVLVKQSARGAE